MQILMALFSPAFPIGAFSYSHGMEAAIHSGTIGDYKTAHDWIETCVIGGSGRNDAILMANTYNAVSGQVKKGDALTGVISAEIEAINDLAFALCSGAERAQESRELGENFIRAVDPVYKLGLGKSPSLAYSVAAGLVTRCLGCDLTLGLTFFLQSFVSNLISVAVRAVPIGQSDGQIILARMMPVVATLAKEQNQSLRFVTRPDCSCTLKISKVPSLYRYSSLAAALVSTR